MSSADSPDPDAGRMTASTGTALAEAGSETETTTTIERTTTHWVDGRDGKMPWSLPQVALWAALPLFLLLALLATPWAVGHIEDELVAETRSDLEAAGIDTEGLDIDYDYRDGEASGLLPAGVAVPAAEAAVDDGLLRQFEVTATPAADPAPAEAAPVDEDEPEAAVATGPVDVDAVYDGAAIVVTGTVLGEGQRVAVLEAVQAVAGRATIDDQLVVSGLDAETPGADARVADLVSAIGTLGPADAWSARLTDDALTVEASVADADAAQSIEDAGRSLRAVPTTVTVTGAAGTTAEISSLQSELDALIPEIRERVVFATGSDALTADAQATLDKVVAAMERYPNPVVEVSGHTDDVGDAGANAALSQRRAAAVEAYLVAEGIDADRLMSRGAGQDEPIDTNDTADGRANNRRVELIALEGF